MYTAKLISVAADPENPNVSVSTIEFYKDNILIITDVERGLSLDRGITLTGYCRQKIQALTEQESITEYINNPPLGDIDISPIQPTAEEKAKFIYQQSLFKLQSLKSQADLGVITLSSPDYQAALIDAQSKIVK